MWLKERVRRRRCFNCSNCCTSRVTRRYKMQRFPTRSCGEPRLEARAVTSVTCGHLIVCRASGAQYQSCWDILDIEIHFFCYVYAIVGRFIRSSATSVLIPEPCGRSPFIPTNPPITTQGSPRTREYRKLHNLACLSSQKQFSLIPGFRSLQLPKAFMKSLNNHPISHAISRLLSHGRFRYPLPTTLVLPGIKRFE